MKVPDFIDYDDDDPKKKFRENRYAYWKVLKELQQEYKLDNDKLSFVDWVKERYGLQPMLFNDGFADEYKITDEKKFLFLVLKYGPITKN